MSARERPSPVVFLNPEEADAWIRFYCVVRTIDGLDWPGEADAALLEYRKRQMGAEDAR